MTRARNQEFSSGVGGLGPSGIKSSDNVFLFFLVLNLFYRSPVVTFKENYYFYQGSSREGIFYRWGGGPTFFQWGSNCFFPIEAHITCDFPVGIRTPCPPPPLGIHPFDSTHLCLIFLLVFSLFFFNITFANLFLEGGGNVASAVVVVTKVSLHSQWCVACGSHEVEPITRYSIRKSRAPIN